MSRTDPDRRDRRDQRRADPTSGRDVPNPKNAPKNAPKNPSSNPPSILRAEAWALVGCVALYVLLSLATFNQMEEDAFIYFRSAENIAQGFGYVFNRGEAPIETGSSWVWQMLVVAFTALPVPLWLSAKLVGVAIGSGNLLLVHRLAGRFISDPAWRVFPSFMLATSVPVVMWNQRGLESASYGAIVLSLVLFCTSQRLARYWMIPTMLLVLGRSEGMFVALALLPFWILRGRQKGAPLRSVLGASLVFGLFVIVLFGARFLYFHDFMPSAFYAKFNFETAKGVSRIGSYFLWTYSYLLALPLLFVVWRRSYWTPERIVLWSFTLVLLGWAILAKDFKPFFRHLVPVLPLFFVLIVSSYAILFPAGRGRGRSEAGSRGAGRRRAAGLVVCGALAVAGSFFSSTVVGPPVTKMDNPIRPALWSLLGHPLDYAAAIHGKVTRPLEPNAIGNLARRSDEIRANYQSLVGEFIRLNYPEGITVVYDQMGQTPYHAGFDKSFIDSGGLVDRTIGYFRFQQRSEHSTLLGLYFDVFRWSARAMDPTAKFPTQRRQVSDYIFGRKPELILINEYSREVRRTGLVARLLADRRIARYRRSCLLAGLVRVYERRDLPAQPLRIPQGLELACADRAT